MKNLYICKSPFQVIVAIILQMKEFQGDRSDIILVKQFNEVDKIGNNCKKLELFRNVYYADTDYEKSWIRFTFAVMFPKVMLKSANVKLDEDYDRIFSANLYGDIDNAIFAFQKRAKPCLYDIGYETYTKDFLYANRGFSKKHLLLRNISKRMLKRIYIDEVAEDLYLFDPELCVINMPFIIHKIDTTNLDISDNISYVFDIENVLDEYKTKYIFFEECFASDFNNNGDLPIIEMLEEIINPGEFMIKLHPRDKTDRFKKMGIITNKNLGVPTEAIAQQLADKDKVFITFSSGSVINYKFLCKSNIKSILLYKLVPKGFIEMPEDRLVWFERFSQKYGNDIFIPESMDELHSILECIEG